MLNKVYISILILLLSTFVPASFAEEMNVLEEGKNIAFDRTKGNCLACHSIEGGNLPGNSGPPLIWMKERYPNKDELRQQIYDPRINNPNTLMPPMGAHGILTQEELDKVVEFIYTL